MNKYIKTILKTLNIVLICIFIFYFSVETYNHHSEIKKENINYRLSKSEYSQIKDGDIILRQGYGFVSDMIVKTLAEDLKISHCAIVIKNDTTFSVIHSVSQSISDYDGVQIQDIRQFVNDSKENSIIVLRTKDNPSGTTNELISDRANYYLNKRVPFDMSFDINDTTRFFCTELIWKVLLETKNIDIFENKYGENDLDFLKFDVFFNPEIFDIVFSHHHK